jgi:hypothetical protein
MILVLLDFWSLMDIQNVLERQPMQSITFTDRLNDRCIAESNDIEPQ